MNRLLLFKLKHAPCKIWIKKLNRKFQRKVWEWCTMKNIHKSSILMPHLFQCLQLTITWNVNKIKWRTILKWNPKLRQYIARFSGATKCSAWHCLRQCWALPIDAPINLAIHMYMYSQVFGCNAGGSAGHC